MILPRYPHLSALQIQQSHRESALLRRVSKQKNLLLRRLMQFSKDQSERNANRVLDELSTSRELIVGNARKSLVELLSELPRLYGPRLQSEFPRLVSTTESVIDELGLLFDELQDCQANSV